ncbi:alpha-ketoglutarate-dependent dioxygenase AlkB [Aureispira sp. CCB-E]|uniref:alpha-ketoglutarate-dependent dioxygenase AlkB family protein n=1 Tax=Aureispira sp. CCB-E TaxID=3051121 RepID=UPI00286886C6|nr:alpha-ketoglutarate-dependent dioxygenase AlkB [Aureispira sp. CCB-E]WMX13900.1 alpha-ketoglutarate-dependent dioxygenase AlkB [Aureispira sp. CCB-E]
MKSSKNKAISILSQSDNILYYNNFLSTVEAQVLYQKLLHNLDWQQYPIRMFGKTIWQPRLIAWYGDKGIQYTYSQTTLTAEGWDNDLKQLREKLQHELQLNFNSVLANLYRDGQDSMGWHSDDEKELGTQPTIASISLGTARKFQLRQKEDHKIKTTVLLEPGSLLLMQGDSQHKWQHQIAKTKRITTPRINLTFRKIQP